jgi:hypothetical protein
MATLLSKPTLSGLMRQSSQYRVMGVGITDSIMLIGHADADIMYEPYQVVDMREVVNFLGADSTSPLLRGVLEAYNAGCKDIWIYPAAPMSEYEEVISNRLTDVEGQNFYERYYDRLTSAYSDLVSWDVNEIIVPIEAVFYDSGNVDFVSQLVTFCADAFATTGVVTLGVIGTRISEPTSSKIDAMAADSRISDMENGNFVMIALGEGLINLPQISTTYISSLAVQTAALISTVSLGRSIAGIKMPFVSSVVGPNYSEAQIEALTQAKINPVVRSKRGKRGATYEAKLLTDNTLGQEGSDFWAMTQMRIVSNCINQIRFYGYSFIGEAGSENLKQAIYYHLDKLRKNNYIRDFSLNITMEERNSRAVVSIGITPIFGIRNIYFQTEVGPGV